MLSIQKLFPGLPGASRITETGMGNGYQRRTLRGTGRKKKTVPVGTGKNPGAGVASLTLSMAGFFCIFTWSIY